jgi:hypothetical protein
MPPESLVIQATLQRPHREHSAASSLNMLLWQPPQQLLVSPQLWQRLSFSSQSFSTPCSKNNLRENWEDGKKALENLVDKPNIDIVVGRTLGLGLDAKGKGGV